MPLLASGWGVLSTFSADDLIEEPYSFAYKLFTKTLFVATLSVVIKQHDQIHGDM